MPAYEIITLSSAEELAQTAARKWLTYLRALNSATPYVVALSGGRIAGRFFSAAADGAGAFRQLLAPVHLFWSDERCVPPEDPESNFALARKLLLEPLEIPDSQIHRVRGEEEPEAAASHAAGELRGVAPSNAAGQPVLDLVFLGMGEDGHVASLFPGEPEATADDPAIYRPVLAVKPPPRRITMGYLTIAAARQVWVLASGAGKERALRDSLAPEGRTPLARVLKMRSQTTVFTDIPT
ncbi:6-phosphogluconolactonase [Verrucomicrobia bacterium]|nr:6-phosphogluconolactonase [Verrucomicrobiota bacterium]